MKNISIDASAKQLSRLRNGHRVRIKKAVSGMGFNLLVDPSKFDTATKCFAKGSAYQIQLSPDEIMANKSAIPTMEGQGIFAGGKVSVTGGLKKLGSMVVRGATSDDAKRAAKVGKTALGGLKVAEKTLRTTPITRAIIKEGVPLVVEEGLKAGIQAYGGDPVTAKIASKAASAGTKAGLKQAGYGLYAGSQGRGMEGCGMMVDPSHARRVKQTMGFRGGALPGPPSRLPERSSISIGGSLMSMANPALASQAFAANFSMNTQLPPQFQRGGIRFV